MSDFLFHIVSRNEWDAAQASGVYHPASLQTEGFIHLSNREQVLGTANRFYQGQTGLVLLVLDAAQLTAPLRFDEVPDHGTFPHLYGPLNLDAVRAVVPFPPQADGSFVLPEGLPSAAE